MAIPSALSAALASLPQDPRFELLEDWKERSSDCWAFRFRVRLTEPPTEHMPEWTAWYLVVTGAQDDYDIRIFPDAEHGITATFPHQDFNGEPKGGQPWRPGKPCLERPAFVFHRDGWADEPLKVSERIFWRIGRLLSWVNASAAGRLLEEGDALELPIYPALDTTKILGFRETDSDLQWWIDQSETWGFATFARLPGAMGTDVVADFMDPTRRSIRRVAWSSAIPIEQSRVNAVWLLLPAMPVFEPWRTAATWYELSVLCKGASIDLPTILAKAGAALRHIQRPKHASPVHLLIGFPIAERVGESNHRIHWVAVQNMQLCRRKDVRPGFSNTEDARRRWDRELAEANKPLDWRRTANWASDQLRKRGEAEDEVRRKSVLVVGIGTLGAAVAENLLRMGVIKLGLIDPDDMLVGNLSRHLLTMADAGHNKADRMAARLNLAAPDADVKGMPFSFPPERTADLKFLQGWDVVVDCTASDAVLRSMASFPWVTERIFVTLAMTWRGEGLFAYTTSEDGFPAVDAIERFREASPAPDDAHVGDMEGIGCWHPVFPATADDVNLWAAIGSKFVRRAIIERKKMAVLYVQKKDGSIERRDA